MEIVKPDGMVEDGAELIVQRLEIGLRIGLALLIPISEQLVLPCNHIFGGDLVDFPLAEVREQLRFDDILLGLPCAFFQPRLEIVGVDFTERLKAHVQISGILLLKLLLPFQCFSPCGESALAFGLAFSCPVRVLCHHIPRTVFLVLISWHLHPSFLFRRTVH